MHVFMRNFVHSIGIDKEDVANRVFGGAQTPPTVLSSQYYPIFPGGMLLDPVCLLLRVCIPLQTFFCSPEQ